MSLHPGQAGEYSYVRWKAPAGGTYLVEASFTGIDFGGGTTDVHVLHNGISLFDGLVNGYGSTASLPVTPVTVLAGDTLDFAVGFGSNGNYYFDNTGLTATIRATDHLALTKTNSPDHILVGSALTYGGNPTRGQKLSQDLRWCRFWPESGLPPKGADGARRDRYLCGPNPR